MKHIKYITIGAVCIIVLRFILQFLFELTENMNVLTCIKVRYGIALTLLIGMSHMLGQRVYLWYKRNIGI